MERKRGCAQIRAATFRRERVRGREGEEEGERGREGGTPMDQMGTTCLGNAESLE